MSVKQAAANERTSEIAIFARLIKADEGNLTRGLARYLLTLGFDADDQARMRDLAARNQEGNLAREEHEELLNYVKSGHMLALLQSKARRSLRTRQRSCGSVQPSTAQVGSTLPMGWSVRDWQDRRRAYDGRRPCDERSGCHQGPAIAY